MITFLILAVAFLAVVFFILWRKEKKISNEWQEAYTIANERAGKIEDADVYSRQVHDDADAYSRQMHDDADAYCNDQRQKCRDYYWKKVKRAEDQAKNIESSIASLSEQKRELEWELNELELKVFVNSVKIDAYENMKSGEIKNKLALLQDSQDKLIKTGQALNVTTVAAKLDADSQKKQILRCFNSETANIIQSVTAKNVDRSRAKIQRSYDTINRIFSVDGVQLTPAFLESKFEELSLVYAYIIKEEEEKEQSEAIKEQMERE